MQPFNERDYAGLMWGEMSWVEVGRAAKEGRIVVLPLGSTEQHGPMMPVGCDHFLAHSWALEGARRARDTHHVPVVVLPTLPYGRATQHMDFPGTVSLSLDTYLRLLEDIARNAIRAGCRFLGQSAIPIMLAEARRRGHTPCSTCNLPQYGIR